MKQVLIVDDSKLMREMVAGCLRHLGEVEFVFRAQSCLRALPILVVTARRDDESRVRVLEAGATGFLAKPFAPQRILDQARRLLHSEHAAA